MGQEAITRVNRANYRSSAQLRTLLEQVSYTLRGALTHHVRVPSLCSSSSLDSRKWQQKWPAVQFQGAESLSPSGNAVATKRSCEDDTRNPLGQWKQRVPIRECAGRPPPPGSRCQRGRSFFTQTFFLGCPPRSKPCMKLFLSTESLLMMGPKEALPWSRAGLQLFLVKGLLCIPPPPSWSASIPPRQFTVFSHLDTFEK